MVFSIGWVAGMAGLASFFCRSGAGVCRDAAAHAQDVRRVPLIPWLPAMPVLTNLFLMGSLGSLSYMRFGCTVAMLVYYVLLGVHATYEVAHSLFGADAVAENIEQEKIEPPVSTAPA